MTIYYSHYGLPNTPPFIHNNLPTGSEERPDSQLKFSVSDDRGEVVEATIDLTLVFDPLGAATEYLVIVNGIFQTGFSGTITANLTGGFDVVVTPDDILADGDWEATVYAEDDLSDSAEKVWEFGIVTRPELIAVRPIARRIIELEFDLPVRVRDATILLIQPTDRYTPVDWEAHGGDADDAANPANYEFSRALSGVKVGPGEAVDLVAVYAEESSEHGYESSGYIRSTHIEVTVDYQMTPRANYEMTVRNIAYVDGVPMVEVTEPFTGFVVSQVPRNTLTFFGSLAEHHRRIDREGTGDLQTFMSIWQEVMDRVLEDVDAFFWELCDIDRMRPEFLDNLLYDLGNPFAGMFDLTTNQKRKLAATLVQIYREKGTCQGIVNAVRFFVGVDLSGCTDSWGTHWRLSTGTAAAPIPGWLGPYTLSDGPSSSPNPGSETPCYLAPSTLEDIWSFRLISPVTLTQDEKDKIAAIADYMKPAATHYLGVIEP